MRSITAPAIISYTRTSIYRIGAPSKSPERVSHVSQGQTRIKSKLTAIVRLAVCFGNVFYHLRFVVSQFLAVEFLVVVSFIDTHVASVVVFSKRLARLRGGALDIVNAKDVADSTGK